MHSCPLFPHYISANEVSHYKDMKYIKLVFQYRSLKMVCMASFI